MLPVSQNDDDGSIKQGYSTKKSKVNKKWLLKGFKYMHN